MPDSATLHNWHMLPCCRPACMMHSACPCPCMPGCLHSVIHRLSASQMSGWAGCRGAELGGCAHGALAVVAAANAPHQLAASAQLHARRCHHLALHSQSMLETSLDCRSNTDTFRHCTERFPLCCLSSGQVTCQ